MRPAAIAVLLAAAVALSACPSKDEKGLDFTKTQRESLEKAKGVEKTIDEASKKALEASDKP
jgi:hypothetical protein